MNNIPNFSLSTSFANLFISKKLPKLIDDVANKLNSYLLNQDLGSSELMRKKILFIVQYLTVIWFNKLIPEDCEDELYKDLSDILNDVLQTSQSNKKITSNDAKSIRLYMRFRVLT